MNVMKDFHYINLILSIIMNLIEMDIITN